MFFFGEIMVLLQITAHIFAILCRVHDFYCSLSSVAGYYLEI